MDGDDDTMMKIDEKCLRYLVLRRYGTCSVAFGGKHSAMAR